MKALHLGGRLIVGFDLPLRGQGHPRYVEYLPQVGGGGGHFKYVAHDNGRGVNGVVDFLKCVFLNKL